MRLEVSPPLSDADLEVIRVALARADVRFDHEPASSMSNWRRAALWEAVDDEPDPDCQACSPRRTRGATRA